MEEYNVKIDELGKAIHDFKDNCDREIKELKQNGSVDVLSKMATEAANEAISKVTDELETIKAAMNRQESKDEDAVDEKKQDFANYIKKGLETKSLSVSNDGDGGYLAPTELGAVVNARLFETSNMRQIANVMQIGSSGMDVPLDNDEFSASWASETGTRSETDSATLDLRRIETHEIYAAPKATQKLLDDAYIDVESWLADKVSDAIARAENLAFVSGTGVGQPTGFLTNTTTSTSYSPSAVQVIASGSNGSFDGDDVIDLLYALKSGYEKNATFVMSRATEKVIRKLKNSTTTEYIWNFDSVSGVPTVLGKNILRFEDMADPATDSLSLAVGDFSKGYTILDRMGFNVLRDPFSSKPFITFYTTKRVGGGVVNAEAIKVLKLGS